MTEIPTRELSLVRLYLLRALYLFLVTGLAVYVWPGILHSPRHWELMEGQATCMVAAFSLVCALGLRYPVQMLPILLWEVLWKTLWLLLVPFPQWRAGHLDPALIPATIAVSMVPLVYLAIPWRFAFTRYLQAPAERWR